MLILIISISFIAGMFIYSVFNIRKNIYIKSINSGPEKTICLTFDDGPAPNFTPKILEILKKHNIKGTFFLIGKNVLSNQKLVEKISNEGHSIGNHTYYHKATFPLLPIKKMAKEIEMTTKLIEQITFNKIKIFRPSFGITNPNINRVLNKLNLKSIGWDIRSLDTVISDSTILYNRVIKGIDNGGSIILFHDRCKNTVEVLENIIIYCQSKNFQFKTIPEIIDEI